MNPRLLWVQKLADALAEALLEDVRVLIVDTVDPIKKRAVLLTTQPYSKKLVPCFRVLADAFAEANECALSPAAYCVGNRLVLNICMRRRVGPPADVNPLDQVVVVEAS